MRVPAQVNRIVLLPMPMPSVVFALDGSGRRIAGMHPTAMKAFKESVLRQFDPSLEQRASTAFVQEGFVVNLEELLKLKPDVVIQWDSEKAEIEKMERAGIPVLAIHLGKQDSLEGWFRMVGELLGREDRADALISYHQEEIAAVRARTRDLPQEKRPRVLFLYNEQLRTIGSGHYYDEWMDAAGAVNVAAGYSGWVNVTMEEILAWNPDVILISNFTELMPENLYNNTIKGQDWSAVAAVKNRRVYKIPLVGYRWEPPSPESPLMMWWLGKLLHPERFRDIDVVAKVRDFYQRFYGVDLPQEEIERRLHVVP
ncbi:MAG TPA: ABC transporter substrate-binding protein [Thermaerobacter sp.]